MIICKYCNKNFNTNRSLAAHIGAVHKEESYNDWLNSYVTVGKDVLDILLKNLEDFYVYNVIEIWDG